jgi:hypothetical protein
MGAVDVYGGPSIDGNPQEVGHAEVESVVQVGPADK